MNGDIVNIYFRTGGFFGYDSFDIAVNRDGTSEWVHESVSGNSVLPNNAKYSKAETRQFLKAFEQSGVFTWKRNYQPDYIVTDGTQWTVEVERKGKRKFIREGDNLFPPHWGTFCCLFGICPDEIKTAVLELQMKKSIALSYTENITCEIVLGEVISMDFDVCHLNAVSKDNNCITFKSDVVSESSAFESLNDDISRILTHEWYDEQWQPNAIDVPFYKLTIMRYDGTVEMHNGIYDKNHISENWQDVMDRIRRFVPPTGDFILLDTIAFTAVKSEGDITFYSVEVSGADRDYYYFSHDDTLKVGDEVFVPFGRDNELRLGEIIEIEYFSPDELPYPVEKMKYIQRKCEPGEKPPEKTVYCPVLDADIDGGDCMLISDVADRIVKPSALWNEVKWDEEQRQKCLACEWHADQSTHYEKLKESEPIRWSFTEQDVLDAHRFSGSNQPELSKGEKCGCFYCLKIFNSKEITNYLTGDNDCDRDGTAFCPYCEIDSVIGESSGYPITKEFLTAMNKKWF